MTRYDTLGLGNDTCSKIQQDSGESGDTAHDNDVDDAVQPAHFAIPLRAQERPAIFPPGFARAVQDEYAIKYLKRLGALPTADNIALVLANLPLDECHVASAWRSRGSLADVLTIDLNPHARPDVRGSATHPQHCDAGDGAKRNKRSDEGDSFTLARSANQSERGSSDAILRGSRNMFQVGSVCLSFEDMKRKYLLPFKHGMKGEVDVLAAYGMKNNGAVSFVDIPALSGGSTQAAVHLLGRRATQRRVKYMEERAIPPDAKAEVIKQMQSAFFRALPLAALGVHGEHEKLVLYAAITDAKLTQLTQIMAEYLYLQVFAKLACIGAGDVIKQHADSSRAQNQPRAAPEQIESLFVAIVSTFTGLKQRLEREEKGMSLFLPLQLLGLRVAIEALFRIQYPISFSITDSTMQFILLQMDAEVTKLLDPDEHLSRIGVLETTCESTKIMASHPFQAKKRQVRLRDQFFKTSETLHSIFPRPLPGKCRKIIKLRGGASVANYPPHLEPPESQAGSNRSNDNDPSEQPNTTNVGSQAAKQKNASDGGVASIDTRLKLLRIIERRTGKSGNR